MSGVVTNDPYGAVTANDLAFPTDAFD